MDGQRLQGPGKQRRRGHRARSERNCESCGRLSCLKRTQVQAWRAPSNPRWPQRPSRLSTRAKGRKAPLGRTERTGPDSSKPPPAIGPWPARRPGQSPTPMRFPRLRQGEIEHQTKRLLFRSRRPAERPVITVLRTVTWAVSPASNSSSNRAGDQLAAQPGRASASQARNDPPATRQAGQRGCGTPEGALRPGAWRPIGMPNTSAHIACPAPDLEGTAPG